VKPSAAYPLRRCRLGLLLVLISAGTNGCASVPGPSQQRSAATTSPASPASTPVDQPSPSMASVPRPTAEGWLSLSGQPAVDGIQYRDVVWTGRRFVAVGAELGSGGVFIDSIDGQMWHRQDVLSATAFPSVLAAGQTGVVAVGQIDDRPASWFSSDGLAWNQRPGAFPMAPTGKDTISVTDVAVEGAGWLAVGREDPACQTNCGLAPVRAIVWTSTDGLHWTRVPDQASFRGAAMTAVAAAEGGFVAVGLAGAYAAAWTSADGQTWSRAPDAKLFHALPSADVSASTTMISVASGHGRVVAIGYEGAGGGHGPAARAWWSTDGQGWTEANGDAFSASGEVSVIPAMVVPAPDGFLAAGQTNGDCTGGIWASVDGAFWRCIATDLAFTGFTPYALAASPSVEVAVGLVNVAKPSPAGLPGSVWRRVVP
jgi:hypothetical protein